MIGDPLYKQGDWNSLLSSLKNYVRKTDKPIKKGFISYAWEEKPADNKIIQDWITHLRADLLKGALDEVFFDIYNMRGNMENTMRDNIETTDVVFFICNPRFKKRMLDPGPRPGGKSNLAFEVDNVLALLKGKKRTLKVFPLLQGARKEEESVPNEFSPFTLFPFNDPGLYEKHLTGFMSIRGLIPAMYDLQPNDPVYQKLLYQHYVHYLPYAPRLFGRDEAIEQLKNLVIKERVITLNGNKGVGKTALALHVADLLKDNYSFVRYIQPGNIARFAQDLGVPLAQLSQTLRKIPPCLIIADGASLKAHLTVSGSQRLLMIDDGSTHGLTLEPLPDESILEFIQNRLPSSTLKDSQALIAICHHSLPQIISSVEYITSCPWFDLSDFLKYRLIVPQNSAQGSTSLQQAAPTTMSQPTLQKWPMIKAGIKKLVDDKKLSSNVHIMASTKDQDIVNKIKIDMKDCGLDTDSTKDPKTLIIVATPHFKKECDKTLQESIEKRIKRFSADVMPLIFNGDFGTCVPGFLGTFLVRDCTQKGTESQETYEHRLVGTVNPIGVLPSILKDDNPYRPHWYRYAISNISGNSFECIGREDTLAELHEIVPKEPVAITACGGVGKSTLALMYAKQYGDDYDFIRFFNAEGSGLYSSFLALSDDFAKAFGVEPEKDPTKCLAQLKERLENTPRYLLIFDNVDNNGVFETFQKSYLPTFKSGQHVLITSRDDTGWPKALALDLFNVSEANALIYKELGDVWCGYQTMSKKPTLTDVAGLPYSAVYVRVDDRLYYVDRVNQTITDSTPANLREFDTNIRLMEGPLTKDDIDTIHKLTGKVRPEVSLLGQARGLLPLALTTATAFIKQKRQDQPTYGVGDYLKEPQSDSDDPVTKSLTLSLPKIESTLPGALKLLRYCSFLSPDHIVPYWFETLLGSMPHTYKAISVLAQYGVIKIKNKKLYIHRFMQDALQKGLSKDEIFTEYLLPLANTLCKLYPLKKEKLEDFAFIKDLSPHLEWLEEHLSKSPEKNTEIHRKILDCLSDYYGMSLNYAKQKIVLEKMLPIKRGEVLLKTVHDLIDVCGYLKDSQKQIEYLEKGLDLCAYTSGNEESRPGENDKAIKSDADDEDRDDEYINKYKNTWHANMLHQLSIAMNSLDYKPNQFIPRIANAIRKQDETIMCEALEVIEKLTSEQNLPDMLRYLVPLISKDFLLKEDWYDGRSHKKETVEDKMMFQMMLKVTPQNLPSLPFLFEKRNIFTESGYMFNFLLKKPHLIKMAMESDDKDTKKLGFEALLDKDLERWRMFEQDIFPLVKAAIHNEDEDIKALGFKALGAFEFSPDEIGQLHILPEQILHIIEIINRGKHPGEEFRKPQHMEALRKLKFSPDQLQHILLMVETDIQDKDKDRRARALTALISLDFSPEQILSILETAIKDREKEVRKAALEALISLKLPPEQLLPILETAIKDSELRLRLSALIALIDLKLPQEQILPILEAAMKDESSDVRRPALKVLIDLKLPQEQILPILETAIKDSELRLRLSALIALIDLKLPQEQILPILEAAMKDERADVRWRALKALIRLKLPQEQILPTLETAMQDSELRSCALNGLIGLKLPQEQILPILETAMKDRDEVVRNAALDVLIGLVLSQEQILHILETAMKDEDCFVRRDALDALIGLKLPQEQILPILEAAMKDERADVRWPALDALIGLKLPQEQILPTLETAMQDSELRSCALNGLIGLKLPQEQILPILETAMKDRKKEVRKAALNGLIGLKLPQEQILPIIETAIKDESEYVRMAALNGLIGLVLSQEQILPIIETAIKDESEYVRMAALDALIGLKLPPEQILPILETAIKARDEKVRRDALNGLIGLKLPPEQILPILETAIKDMDATVRRAALNGLIGLKLPPEHILSLLEKTMKNENSDVKKDILHAIPFSLFQIVPKKSMSLLEDAMSYKDSIVFSNHDDPIKKPSVRSVALEALYVALCLHSFELTHEQSLSIFERAINDVDGCVRKVFLKSLDKLTFVPKERLLMLEKAMDDRDVSIRKVAMNALLRENLSSEHILSILEKAIKNWNPEVRCYALDALAKLQIPQAQKLSLLEQKLPLLERTIRAKNVNARAVFKTLVDLKLPPEWMLPIVGNAIKYKKSDVQKAGLYALTDLQLPSEQVLPIIENAIKDKDPGVRNTALDTLIGLGLPREQVLSALQTAIKDDESNIFKVTRETLSNLNLKPEQSLIIIKSAMKSSTTEFDACFVLKMCLTCLTDLQQEPILVSFIKDNNTRNPALNALIGLRLPLDKVQIILEMAMQDKDENFRLSVLSALIGLELSTKLKLLLFEMFMKDQNADVRKKSITLLRDVKLTVEQSANVLPMLIRTVQGTIKVYDTWGQQNVLTWSDLSHVDLKLEDTKKLTSVLETTAPWQYRKDTFLIFKTLEKRKKEQEKENMQRSADALRAAGEEHIATAMEAKAAGSPRNLLRAMHRTKL